MVISRSGDQLVCRSNRPYWKSDQLHFVYSKNLNPINDRIISQDTWPKKVTVTDIGNMHTARIQLYDHALSCLSLRAVAPDLFKKCGATSDN